MRVQDWCYHQPIVIARGSEDWDAPDGELNDGKWELPSHIPRIQLHGFKLVPNCEYGFYYTPTYS